MNVGVRKVTISVDSALLDAVERLAAEDGQSRSEAVAAALELALKQRKTQKAVSLLLEETGGGLTPKQRAQARRFLGLRTK
jgi:metal-responsive CopG/Arc/MetJ family transcriptional regulator